MTTEKLAPSRPGASRRLAIAQADLEFMLGRGYAEIDRSTFGAMLERADMYGHDSDGRPIPRATGECITIKSQRQEASYDPDERTLERIGRASRYLDLVGHVSATSRRVLEAYHGDRGARWGRPMREDSAGGVGCREVAVYPLTAMGGKWIVALRAQVRNAGAEHLAYLFQPDELLAREYVTGQRKRDDMRAHRLSRCAVEARVLIAEATATLEAAAEYHAGSLRQIRRAAVGGAA